MSVAEVKKAWEIYWEVNKDRHRSLDPMSRRILREIFFHCGSFTGKTIIEAGSGSGIVSLEIARAGGDVYLLDIARDALGIAESLFRNHGLTVRLVQGDIFHLPLRGGFCDVVWNAGVMEHFLPEAHPVMAAQVARILKPGGLFVTLNPSAGARFYIAGKKTLEARGEWPYGPEYPVTSLAKACIDAGLSVTAEYPICFRDNLYYYSYVSRPAWKILRILTRAFPERLLIHMFGGYLLVTVAVKPQ